MSNRSLLELNHDYTPHGDDELAKWAKAMLSYLRSGDKSMLPPGVTWKHMRHHSENCPLSAKVGH